MRVRRGVRAGAPQAPRVRIALVASIAAMAVAPGCGREVVGVAKPRALRAWGPTPAHPADMTVVKATPTAVYVGFSDGEVFARTPGAGGWVAFVGFNIGECGASQPSGPVTSFAVTADRMVASFSGTPGASTIWHSSQDVVCWAPTGILGDIWSLSVSPFYRYELLAMAAQGVWVTEQAVGSWGYDVRPCSLGFEGVATPLATGLSDDGSKPRAW